MKALARTFLPHLWLCVWLGEDDDVTCSRVSPSAWLTYSQPCAGLLAGLSHHLAATRLVSSGWGWLALLCLYDSEPRTKHCLSLKVAIGRDRRRAIFSRANHEAIWLCSTTGMRARLCSKYVDGTLLRPSGSYGHAGRESGAATASLEAVCTRRPLVPSRGEAARRSYSTNFLAIHAIQSSTAEWTTVQSLGAACLLLRHRALAGDFL